VEGVPEGLVVEVDALARAPWYRREPYLVLFPLGVFLSWAGVGHWLLHSLGYIDDYRSIFHAMVQVQGFLTCFAFGFLFTMIPRRTASRPPAAWQMAVACLAPVATTVAAWNEVWYLAQAAWLVAVFTLIGFAVRRFAAADAGRRPPPGFVWIPLGLLMGVAGAALAGVGAARGEELFWLHDVGRNMVLQGMFVGLVLGVGGLVFPLMTRSQAPADAGPGDRAAIAGHAALALLLAASFPLEVLVSLRAALALRAAIVLLVFLASVELWRLPDQPGLNRRLVWTAGWMLPLGYIVAALWPEQEKAGLHVVFLGCFATLALAVGAQVTMGHRGARETMLGNPWQIAAIGVLMALATLARGLMEFDRTHFFHWMAVASTAFLAATALWMLFLVPLIVRARSGGVAAAPGAGQVGS
jgi:uncharacterized protein involved in response to NO